MQICFFTAYVFISLFRISLSNMHMMQISLKPSKMHNLYLLPLKKPILTIHKKGGGSKWGNSRKRTCRILCNQILSPTLLRVHILKQPVKKKQSNKSKHRAIELHLRQNCCNFISQMNPNLFDHTTRTKTSYRFKGNVQI